MKLIRSLLFSFCFVLVSSASFAESPPAECFTDSDCPAGRVCAAEVCRPRADVCATSEDCGSGRVCDVAYNSCPYGCDDGSEGCPERCAVPNGYCANIPTPCQGDAECPSDKLCSIALAPACAEGDEICEEAPKLGCVVYLLFCGPEEDYFNCSAQETCNAHGRCIWTAGADYTALSETVVTDEEKASRLREQWIAEIAERQREDSRQFGCSTTGQSNGPTTLVIAGLTMLVVLRQGQSKPRQTSPDTSA